ncbi:MAG: hypothetical protein Q4B08_13665 [Propionibacteriaceae bacterium]|nr:hypothetical protein [Propionibacteriaceae bacterium]
MSGGVIRSLDLIVADLEEASDFIEQVASYSSRECVKGFSCYRFGAFDVMLSESALIDIGTVSGVVLHIEVADVAEHVRLVAERSGLRPSFGPEPTDWGTYSAIYRSEKTGLVIDIYSGM